MIPYNFDYEKPSSFSEAISIYEKWEVDGKNPIYYCGGTEIITMARMDQIQTKGVIDIKGMPECLDFGWEKDQLVIGAAIPLAKLEEEKAFPLLSRVCNRIADHTSRCKITIGGNITGKINYREAVLPLLVADATCVIASKTGMKQIPIHDVFDGKVQIQPPEFLLQVRVERKMTTLPYLSEKRTKIDRIGYPVVSLAAIHAEDGIRIAFSGLCTDPFRSLSVEEELNNRSQSLESKVQSAIEKISVPILDDHHASSAYRKFILSNLLVDIIKEFDEVSE
ncbi:FAD binding domain-containing protein [Ammoniphilus resinae]|uniref:CO/xanthine dehydrogenase FAD-binding subunit n=1 Tax=Ammoniphilus resinae TaxID=861532 RepID=A0ABS4GXA4_9BACL|nr:FAD binding domain-containing protein [Ammoniphilus resinae]MBP1934910.1 CO/xanthine dehydrogenase FAD-binding subunit [Ammoniphilus resinae]